MAKAEELEKRDEIIIDPKELPEGGCHVRKWGKGRVSICREDGKIKIFEVIKEEKSHNSNNLFSSEIASYQNKGRIS